MYGADYVNAYQNSSTDNWLFITNGWSGNTAEYEWTMSRKGSGNAWHVHTGGYLGYYAVYNTLAVRPVFYLLSTVKLTGTGISTDPYRINS